MKITHNGIQLEVTDSQLQNDILAVLFGTFTKAANNQRPEFPPVKKRRKTFPLGSRPWTEEEKIRFRDNVQILRNEGLSTAEIIRRISRNFNRTRSAISSYIYAAKLQQQHELKD